MAPLHEALFNSTITILPPFLLGKPHCEQLVNNKKYVVLVRVRAIA